MSSVVVLDSGPLAMVAHKGGRGEVDECQRWLMRLLSEGARVVVPEIADYEVRRELLRAKKIRSVERLDALEADLEYLPLTTAAMRRAASLWAEARQRGRPTADSKALDGDVILAAQALTVSVDHGEVVVATTNVGHLRRFVKALSWQAI